MSCVCGSDRTLIRSRLLFFIIIIIFYWLLIGWFFISFYCFLFLCGGEELSRFETKHTDSLHLLRGIGANTTQTRAHARA